MRKLLLVIVLLSVQPAFAAGKTVKVTGQIPTGYSSNFSAGFVHIVGKSVDEVHDRMQAVSAMFSVTIAECFRMGVACR